MIPHTVFSELMCPEVKKKKSLRKLFLKLKVPECWIWIRKSVWHWPKRLVYLAFTHHNTHHQFDPLNLITLVKVLALNHAVTVFWQCLDLYWPMRRSFLTHHVCRIDGRRNASDHFWVLIQHELERTTSSLNRVTAKFNRAWMQRITCALHST